MKAMSFSAAVGSNERMRRRSPIRNGVEFALALVVLKSLEWAPRPIAERFALAYTRLLDLALPRLRRVALRNLAMALPECGAERRLIDGCPHIRRHRRDTQAVAAGEMILVTWRTGD